MKKTPIKYAFLDALFGVSKSKKGKFKYNIPSTSTQEQFHQHLADITMQYVCLYNII